MRNVVKLHTTVLPGHRIEVASPELPEGAEVELTVTVSRNGAGSNARPTDYVSVLDFLDSLPVGPRSAKTWEEIDGSLQHERSSWDR